VPLAVLATAVVGAAPTSATATADGVPRVIALDGRSASGKTTLARRLAAVVPGAVVVSTDDVAWWHSFFDWDDLLVEGVLQPLRRGAAAPGGVGVAFRPRAWQERGREGAVVVPAGTRVVLLEGDGSSRRALGPWLDAAVWVQSDAAEQRRREDARIAAGEVSAELSRDWLAAEEAFFADDRPWERADVVVAGTPSAALGREVGAREVVVGRLPAAVGGEP